MTDPTDFTDDELRKIWRAAGGRFHGPNVETGTMPEAKLLPFLRVLMREEMQARTAVPSPSAPEGWKLVPVEPTREMLEAALPDTERQRRITSLLWEAMLDAAPAAPPAASERAADAPSEVYCVHSKTTNILFARREDAEALATLFGAASSLSVTAVPVIGAAAAPEGATPTYGTIAERAEAGKDAGMWDARGVEVQYSFCCYSCANEWEAMTPESDCPRAGCGTTNRFCAENAPGVREDGNAS